MNKKIFPNSKVVIIILNWNGWKDTIECLESLYQISYFNYDVIVVDNGSKDDSHQKIKEYCQGDIKVESRFFKYNKRNKPIHVVEYLREEATERRQNKEDFSDLPSNRKLTLIKNEKNYGFAEGNNIGMRYSLNVFNPDYILLLNNDTVVDRNFLNELINVTENNEKIGIIGPKIYHYDKPTQIQFIGGKINWLTGKISRFKNNKNKGKRMIQSDFILGAAFLMKAKLVEDIGLLDPDYFVYYEEADFCIRSIRAGFNNFVILDSKIWHKLSATIGGDTLNFDSNLLFSKFGIYYIIRNRYIFMKKNAQSNSFKHLPFLFFYVFDIIKKIIIYGTLGKYDVVRFILKGFIDGINYNNNF